MLEGTHRKASEHYPLLMVAGAGDATIRVPPPVGPNLWTTTMTARRSWRERWPEYLSSCWLATILLGISFLVFYSVAMAVIYRNDSYVIFKLNETNSASEVFYHHIVPHGGAFPLSKYGLYLANVARTYRSLTFKVFFLIDDRGPQSFLDKIYTLGSFPEYNTYNKREVKMFQRKFQNVYISVMPLSKFMAGTPLKYKWRSIPIKYIPFYCRIFAVWMNGGIGLDLAEHNYHYHTGIGDPQRVDRKARALMKQHNSGIIPENYMKNLHKLENEDNFEYLASFMCMVQKMFEDTFSFFNSITTTSISEKPTEPELANTKSLVRTHRAKREVLNLYQHSETIPGNTSKPSEVNIVLTNKTVFNVTGESNQRNVYETIDQSNSKPGTIKENVTPKLILVENGWYFLKFLKNKNPEARIPEHSHNTGKNNSEDPKITLFYDLFSDEGKSLGSDVSFNSKAYFNPLKVATIEAEGSFVASTERLHPFLADILAGGCKHLSPKLAIRNSLQILCTDVSRDDLCKSIFVL